MCQVEKRHTAGSGLELSCGGQEKNVTKVGRRKCDRAGSGEAVTQVGPRETGTIFFINDCQIRDAKRPPINRGPVTPTTSILLIIVLMEVLIK